jgi:hypothetical protein
MLYEYRRYEVTPGRKPDLDARFTNLTMPLWERHGIRAHGLFDPEIGTSNELHYLLAWESLAEREQATRNFLIDPEWIAGRAESEAAGALTVRTHSQIWRPTTYSPLR